MDQRDRSFALSYAKDIAVARPAMTVTQITEMANVFLEWLEQPSDLELATAALKSAGILDKACKIFNTLSLTEEYRNAQRDRGTFIVNITNVLKERKLL